MATIDPVIVDGESRTFLASWSLGDGDMGAPIRYPGAADRTVQLVGNFGGATVAIQGSLDGEHWATLSDGQGNAISVTGEELEAITELVRFVRPVVTGGSGASITVLLLLMRTTI